MQRRTLETPTAFFVRYYVNESYANGRRKTKCEKLADRSDLYRSQTDVKPLFDAARAKVNGQQNNRANGQTSLADYFEKFYFPWAETNKAPATANGYKQVWFKYLQPHIGRIALTNLRTVQVTELLDHHAKSGLSRYTLSHIKFVLSGLYEYATKTGVLARNPVEKAGWTVGVARPKEQVRYSLESVLKMLRVLEPIDLKAAVAVALAYFAALRPAEIRGLKWADYNGTELHVQRGMWRNKIGQTKTEGSSECVLVIEPLKSLLEKLRSQSAKGFILQSSRGTPLSLDALNGRVITPALEKAGIDWCGYYACRRGISSKITDVSKNALNSSGLLRNDAMTVLQFYTEAQSDSTQRSGRGSADQADAPSVKLVYLSMSQDADMAAEAFRRGASAYLLKTCVASELTVAVREVLNGGSYLSPVIASDTLDFLLRQGKVLVEEGDRLTERQREVL